MSVFTEVQGDLFDPENKVIAHGCNCVGLYSAGVAGMIRERHPIAFEKYDRAINAGVFVPGYAQFVVDNTADRCIYNLATQAEPGAVPTATTWQEDRAYWIVYLAFVNMFEHAKANAITKIAIPFIGAGIARLDWERVRAQAQQADHDTLYTGVVEAIYQ